MRFPLRLTLDVARVSIAQKLFGAARRPLALQVNLARLSAQPEAVSLGSDITVPINSSRDLQALAVVRASTAPIVWIGGDTPLHYPRIGQLTREIVNLGRSVFIEMDGRLVRRRIHEFRPVSRLYLVLPLYGLQDAHDLRMAHLGSFRATIESIRTAKLSGFHVCVETPIFADTDGGQLGNLANFITTLAVDGWIQKSPAVPAADQPSEEKLADARKLIPSRGWRSFSKQLTAGVPHAEFACGEIGNVPRTVSSKPTDQSTSKLPTREESVRAL